MQVGKIYPRNRRIAGRTTGTVFFDLRWSNGRITKRDVQFQTLKSAIKFLTDRLKYIPDSDKDSLEATLFAEIRKPIGSMGRISLATCIGEKSLPELFAQAESVWKELEHEDGDQKLVIPDVVDVDGL